MPAKTRTQPIDASSAFNKQGAERIEALKSGVLTRLSATTQAAIEEANQAFGFDVTRFSDDLSETTEQEAFAGIRPAEGDYSGLRNVRHPNFSLGLCANEEGVMMRFQIRGALEWRLFIKAIYQHREMLGDYITEFEELYLSTEDDEEAIEELDQFFAVDVESADFKKQGCSIYFPPLDYPVETEEDFETFEADFSALFPFYWTLLKSARGEPVDMDALLNG